MIPSIIYWLIVLELILVSWGDVRTQKIPNFWSILNLVVFTLLLMFWPEFYPLQWTTFIYSTVFLIVNFTLFALRIMGGGDSKFLVTFFLLIPVALQPKALISLLICTILIGSFMFLTNFGKNYEKIVSYTKSGYIKGIKECFGTKFSFAPVILLAWMWLGWEIGMY